MKLLNNRVLVKPDEMIKVNEFGISLSKEEKPTTGVVVIGNGKVKKGNKVLFSKFGYDEVVLEDGTFYVISNPNILAIL